MTRLRQIEQCLKNSHFQGESPRIFNPVNPMLAAAPFTPGGLMATPNQDLWGAGDGTSASFQFYHTTGSGGVRQVSREELS